MEIPFENPLFLIPFSFGLISIIAGWIMLKYPPKEINGLYGYRTKSSMKNQERWDFSQNYGAKEMIRMGVLSIILSLISFIYVPSENLATFLGLGIMILLVILLIVRVESAIKKQFGKN